MPVPTLLTPLVCCGASSNQTALASFHAWRARPLPPSFLSLWHLSWDTAKCRICQRCVRDPDHTLEQSHTKDSIPPTLRTTVLHSTRPFNFSDCPNGVVLSMRVRGSSSNAALDDFGTHVLPITLRMLALLEQIAGPSVRATLGANAADIEGSDGLAAAVGARV